jgi:hypothetical protein
MLWGHGTVVFTWSFTHIVGRNQQLSSLTIVSTVQAKTIYIIILFSNGSQVEAYNCFQKYTSVSTQGQESSLHHVFHSSSQSPMHWVPGA